MKITKTDCIEIVRHLYDFVKNTNNFVNNNKMKEIIEDGKSMAYLTCLNNDNCFYLAEIETTPVEIKFRTLLSSKHGKTEVKLTFQPNADDNWKVCDVQANGPDALGLTKTLLAKVESKETDKSYDNWLDEMLDEMIELDENTKAVENDENE